MTFNKFIRRTRLESLFKILRLVLVVFSILPVSLSTASGQSCGDTVYDTGGASGSYNNNENWSQTYNASAGEVIQLSFSRFNVENNFDYLYIYDGTDDSAPQLAQLSGTSLPSDYTSSSNVISIKFTSDGSIVRVGFTFTISCITITVPECLVITTPGVANLYSWEASSTLIGQVGNTVDFEAMSLSFDGQTIYTADDSNFVAINPLTGIFAGMGEVGSADGALGTITISDIDGMAINPNNGLKNHFHNYYWFGYYKNI